jgi:hypothetical protein
LQEDPQGLRGASLLLGLLKLLEELRSFKVLESKWAAVVVVCNRARRKVAIAR